MKRTLQRPYGRKKNGGWVILNDALLKALKAGDTVEIGKITVGARQLSQIIRLMPHEDSLIRSNGKLEIEAVDRVNRRDSEGHFTAYFHKPKHNTCYVSVVNGAWLPKEPNTVVVLKPRKY